MARAALFDLDGTLLDSLADIGTACNQALLDHGLPPHALARYVDFVGEGVENLITQAMAPVPFDLAVLTAYKRLYPQQMLKLTVPYTGIEAALTALVAAGLPLAVLSNKPHAPTCALVEHFFGGTPWRAVAGHRTEVPRKPDPTSALALCAQLGVAPQDCVFVGDSAVDVATALNAGMPSIGVGWGFRPHEAQTASYYCPAPQVLAALVQAASPVAVVGRGVAS
ncbi:MAG: HAD family hydrolase [Myxococcales bacterium]|nr:HAD family hydrolase [Myxococcales bacterium]